MLGKLLCKTAPVLAVVVFTMLPNVSQAATCRGQPIYARNNTSRPIWVAAMYKPPGSDCFVTNGFWQVAPGQSEFLLYNSNRYIYFYARNDLGQSTRGNDTTAVVGGETLNMEQDDTGMCFNPWTVYFNP
jgi:uncharacterized membrane protein